MIEKLYYFSHWLYIIKMPFLPRLLMLINHLLFKVSIPYKAKIGKNFKLGHGGFCVINSYTIIVNNIFISSGAVINGPVVIEDNEIIAPNSVVLKSVPEVAIVGGVPAKIIGWVKDLDYDIMKNENWKEGYMPYLTEKK